jgi:hypothetical protein
MDLLANFQRRKKRLGEPAQLKMRLQFEELVNQSRLIRGLHKKQGMVSTI